MTRDERRGLAAYGSVNTPAPRRGEHARIHWGINSKSEAILRVHLSCGLIISRVCNNATSAWQLWHREDLFLSAPGLSREAQEGFYDHFPTDEVAEWAELEPPYGYGLDPLSGMLVAQEVQEIAKKSDRLFLAYLVALYSGPRPRPKRRARVEMKRYARSVKRFESLAHR